MTDIEKRLEKLEATLSPDEYRVVYLLDGRYYDNYPSHGGKEITPADYQKLKADYSIFLVQFAPKEAIYDRSEPTS